MRRVVRAFPILVAAMAAFTGVAAGSPGVASATSCQSWTGSQPSLSESGGANGVSVISPCLAWLVGQANQRSLAMRWNGAAWQSRTVPDWVGTTTSRLTATAATAATDVWAVGDYAVSGAFKALAAHWNGKKWSLTQARQPGTHSSLLGVAARSASDAWAVGTYGGTTGLPLIEHWNGQAWKQSHAPPLPAGGSDGELDSVSVTSSSNAWAVGLYFVGTAIRTLILHWNGTNWSQQASRNPSSAINMLVGVSATSTNNAWAVGERSDASGEKTLIERWNGHHWAVETSANTSDATNALQAITAISATNAWAVGWHAAKVNGSVQPSRTLILHWDGAGWEVVPSPNPAGVSVRNSLSAVGSTGASNVWAVGASDTGNNERPLAVHCC
jgi:hypothetical protein